MRNRSPSSSFWTSRMIAWEPRDDLPSTETIFERRGPKEQPQWWCGMQSLQQVAPLSFLCLLELKWMPKSTAIPFRQVAWSPGQMITSRVRTGCFSRTPLQPTRIPAEWPPYSPDLNPMDFCIWSILESKVSAIQHPSVDSLKRDLSREWTRIPKSVLRDSIVAFGRRLCLVVKARGGYIERWLP